MRRHKLRKIELLISYNVQMADTIRHYIAFLKKMHCQICVCLLYYGACHYACNVASPDGLMDKVMDSGSIDAGSTPARDTKSKNKLWYNENRPLWAVFIVSEITKALAMIINLIQEIIRSHYEMEISEVKKLTVGAGSDTYFVKTDSGNFILKSANVNEANNPQNEPPLCEFLIQKGLPVSEFIKNVYGDYTFTHDDRVYHMQKFVDGISYEWHAAPT